MPDTPAETHPIISYEDAEQLVPRDLVRRWLEHPEDAPDQDQDECLERVALAAAAAVAVARDLAPSMHRALARGVELIDVAEAAGLSPGEVAQRCRRWAKRRRRDELTADQEAELQAVEAFVAAALADLS